MSRGPLAAMSSRRACAGKKLLRMPRRLPPYYGSLETYESYYDVRMAESAFLRLKQGDPVQSS